ncbi:MAG: ABC transporter substrate-binding protein [Bacteroidaceae bacterium]|nr:ABC transporter substrate-binding protein [Bacteroidaceae bacterium]
MLLLIIQASCQKGEKGAVSDNAELDTLRVAVMPTLGCLPLYIAEKEHIFDSLGIDVKLTTYQAQMDIDTAITRGHTDVAYSDMIRAMLLQQAGTQVFVASEAEAGLTLITARRGRVRNLHQLKERMVAMARHSITDYWCDRMADTAGLGRSEFFRPQINSLKIRRDMLLAGTMDAAFLPEPQATMASLLRHRRNFSTSKLTPRLGVWVTTDSTKSDLISRLWKAYNIAAERITANNNESDIASLLRTHYSIPDSLADTISNIVTTKLFHFPEPMPIKPSEDAVKTALKWLDSRSLRTKGYKADTLVIHSAQ